MLGEVKGVGNRFEDLDQDEPLAVEVASRPCSEYSSGPESQGFCQEVWVERQ
jgi:hypothetical protein